jgi:hypothetical protein
MINRSARVAASRSGCLPRRECSRGVLVGALSATLRGFLLELCLLGRKGGDLRRPSFSGSAPAVGRSRGHGHLVFGSHSFFPSVIPTWVQGASDRVSLFVGGAVVAGQRARESGCVNRSRSPEPTHCCGGHGWRLSALLAENVAPEARRAWLSERARNSTRIRPSHSDLARFARGVSARRLSYGLDRGHRRYGGWPPLPGLGRARDR